MPLAEIIGLVAGTITSVTFIPQVIKIWRSKSVKDISMLMMLLLVLGTSLWLTYGLLIRSTPIIYTNLMVLIMSLTMLFFKLKFKD